jgi:hypothetical protein
MEAPHENMEWERLRSEYDQGLAQLTQALVEGSPWEETFELRSSLADLHRKIYQRFHTLPHPAAFEHRPNTNEVST